MIQIHRAVPDLLHVKEPACVRACEVHVCRNPKLTDQSRVNGLQRDAEILGRALRGLLMGPADSRKFGTYLLLILSGEVFDVPGDLKEELLDSGGIVFGILLDDVPQQTEQYLNSVTDQMVIGLTIDILLRQRVLLGGVTVEHPTRGPRILAAEDGLRRFTHHLGRIRGAAGRQRRTDLLVRLDFDLMPFDQQRHKLSLRHGFALEERVTDDTELPLRLLILTENILAPDPTIQSRASGITRQGGILVRDIEERVQIVAAAPGHLPDSLLEIDTGIASVFLYIGVKFRHLFGRKPAHQAVPLDVHANPAQQSGPTESQEGIRRLAGHLQTGYRAGGDDAVIKTGLGLPKEIASHIGLRDSWHITQRVGLLQRIGHQRHDHALIQPRQNARVRLQNATDFLCHDATGKGHALFAVTVDRSLLRLTARNDFQDRFSHAGGAFFLHLTLGGFNLLGIFFVRLRGLAQLAAPQAVAVISAVVRIPEQHCPELFGRQFPAMKRLRGQSPRLERKVTPLGNLGRDDALVQEKGLHSGDTLARGTDVTALPTERTTLHCQTPIGFENHRPAPEHARHAAFHPVNRRLRPLRGRPTDRRVPQVQRNQNFPTCHIRLLVIPFSRTVTKLANADLALRGTYPQGGYKG